MNEVVSAAIHHVNKGFESVEMYDRARGERGFSTEIHQILMSIDKLFEKYPPPSVTRRRQRNNGNEDNNADLTEALLLSMKLHRETLDILYEVVEQITYIESKIGIPKDKRSEGFK